MTPSVLSFRQTQSKTCYIYICIAHTNIVALDRGSVCSCFQQKVVAKLV